jgi:hypothetical protein
VTSPQEPSNADTSRSSGDQSDNQQQTEQQRRQTVQGHPEQQTEAAASTQQFRYHPPAEQQVVGPEAAQPLESDEPPRPPSRKGWVPDGAQPVLSTFQQLAIRREEAEKAREAARATERSSRKLDDQSHER